MPVRGFYLNWFNMEFGGIKGAFHVEVGAEGSYAILRTDAHTYYGRSRDGSFMDALCSFLKVAPECSLESSMPEQKKEVE